MHSIATSGFLDLPAPLSGSHTVFWLFSGATMVLVAVSIALVVRETVRLRTALPVVVFLSAALWLPNEPYMDAILGFQYASNSPAVLFELSGRVIPLGALGIGAMFFIFPWTIYQMVLKQVSMNRIIAICIAAGVLDWIMEWSAIHWKVFEYYGNNPSRILGLPFTSMVQNCFIYALMAAAIILAAPYLKGWRASLFIPVIPGVYLGGATLCTWPAYLALHAAWPTGVFLILALGAAAMNAYIPITVLQIAADHQQLLAYARPFSSHTEKDRITS